MCIDTADIAVRAGEVDVLHRAQCLGDIRGVVLGLKAFCMDPYDLTRADILYECCSNGVESRGLRCNNVRIAKFSDGERSQPILVANCVEFIVYQYDKGEGSDQSW